MNHTACILCNSIDIIKLTKYEIHRLVKCDRCGFVFMERIPTEEELNAHYKLYSYTNSSEVSPLTIQSFQLLLDEMEKYREMNTIVDVGCGKGWFLLEARKRGWNVYGTEFSDEAIKICKANGIKMEKGDLSNLSFGKVKFDVVFSSEVIEHVNTPAGQFKNMYSILRPGGLLYLTTPNFNCYLRHIYKANYNIIEYPEHLGYFTKKTMHFGLTNAGFKKWKLLTTGVSISRACFSSKSNGNETTEVIVSKDEKLRALMVENGLMKKIKSIVNFILTLTGFGITLKAYYIKPMEK
ncbi:MAG: class I SAM-dependent methyltransferase [Bacteroidia bacterium]